MIAVIDRLRTLRAAQQPFALCLVVHTEGSSYRKPGAVALIGEHCHEGVISGGCLESDLELYARQAIQAGAPRCVAFDTLGDDDLLFGSGSGCRGRMQVLIVPDTDAQRALADALLAADAQHCRLELALQIDGDAVASGFAWFADHELALGGDVDGLRALKLSVPGMHEITRTDGSVRVARFSVPVVPRLLLMGAGPEAAPLLKIAQALGWRCLLSDHRPATMGNLPAQPEQAFIGRPAQALAQFSSLGIDACIVMSHTASNDLEALRALGAHPVGYIGLLGPPMRRDELLQRLTADERTALGDRLRAPVGLNLGGNGPEPLALSIAAQLQQYFAG